MDSLVSIIMPCYNAETYLQASVQSLMKQSYRNIEILLIDDGSQDRTLDLCNHMAKKDARIRVIHQENSGAGASRNRGMAEASGEFIAFLDSDDILLENAIETLLGAMTEDVDVVQCRSRKCYDDDSPDADHWEEGTVVLAPDEAMRDYLFCVPPIIRYAVWGKLIRRETVNGLQFPKISNCEDVVFTMKLIGAARKVKYIPDVLHLFTVRSDSLSHSTVNEKKIKAQITCGKLTYEYISRQKEFRNLMDRARWSYLSAYISCARWAQESEQIPHEVEKQLHRDFCQVLKQIGLPTSIKQKLAVMLYKTSPKLALILFKKVFPG